MSDVSWELNELPTIHRKRSRHTSRPRSVNPDQMFPLSSSHVPMHWKRISVNHRNNILKMYQWLSVPFIRKSRFRRWNSLVLLSDQLIHDYLKYLISTYFSTVVANNHRHNLSLYYAITITTTCICSLKRYILSFWYKGTEILAIKCGNSSVISNARNELLVFSVLSSVWMPDADHHVHVTDLSAGIWIRFIVGFQPLMFISPTAS